MRRFTLPLLSFALLLVLFGCIQGGIPAACANSSVEKLSNCIYIASVLEQNPFDCYSIKDNTQREKCLRDASDSAIKKLLEQMTPEERTKIFLAISGATNTSGIDIILPPTNESITPDPGSAIINSSTGVSEADSQAYVQAVAANDMVLCATITHTSTRASCITQVALRVKNPAVCSQFTLTSDFDLCNFYAKGD